MTNYLVRYYNGRGVREKVFSTEQEAKDFIHKCKDDKATLWRQVNEF